MHAHYYKLNLFPFLTIELPKKKGKKKKSFIYQITVKKKVKTVELLCWTPGASHLKT